MPCASDEECPQYFSGCVQYAGICARESSFDKLEVGDCYCDSPAFNDAACECKSCEGQEGDYINVGISLCMMLDVECSTDLDCLEDGLICSELTGTCLPTSNGQVECSDDSDCSFGWQCIQNPLALPPDNCQNQNDDGDQDRGTYPACCATYVCAPRGWTIPVAACI